MVPQVVVCRHPHGSPRVPRCATRNSQFLWDGQLNSERELQLSHRRTAPHHRNLCPQRFEASRPQCQHEPISDRTQKVHRQANAMSDLVGLPSPKNPGTQTHPNSEIPKHCFCDVSGSSLRKLIRAAVQKSPSRDLVGFGAYLSRPP